MRLIAREKYDRREYIGNDLDFTWDPDTFDCSITVFLPGHREATFHFTPQTLESLAILIDQALVDYERHTLEE